MEGFEGIDPNKMDLILNLAMSIAVKAGQEALRAMRDGDPDAMTELHKVLPTNDVLLARDEALREQQHQRAVAVLRPVPPDDAA